MNTIQLTLPDSLREEAQARATKDNISLDEFVSLAVSKMLAASKNDEYFLERAQRGDEEKFRRVLAKVPEAEPDERDRL